MLGSGKSAREYLEEEYTAAFKEWEERIKITITPAEIRENEKKDSVFEDARELLSLNILNHNIVDAYNELENKLKDKQAEIEMLYGTTVSGESLDVIKEVYHKIKEQCELEIEESGRKFEEELSSVRLNTEVAIQKKRSAAEEETGRILDETENLKTTFERDFERERVEYEYKLQRERKTEQEKRDAEVRARKEELSLKEAEIKETKAGCRKKLDEIDELQTAVDDIPALIDKARAEGAKEKEAELSKNNAYKAEIEKKEQENRIQALKDEYSRLSQKYAELSDEVMELSNRLDQCNAESRRLTGDTVRYIGGINILNSDAHQHTDAAEKK
ncbi:MAG: hypothetical protein IJT63_00295 [Lachnospiraceae bacterium]|nr:hypothetical protein [Lachnospiraceae bacterium]